MNDNENHNDNADEEDLSPLEIDCQIIREDDPTTQDIDLSYSSGVELRDDAKTHLLCVALANNTNLRHLSLDVQGLSVQGAAEFVETVAPSNLVGIGLEGREVAMEIKHALFRMLASQTLKLEKVSIGMPLVEEDVTLLYECLKERRLAKFELARPCFPTSLSVQAAKDLSKIVAKTKEVVISGHLNEGIQRILFKDGIQASQHAVVSLTLQCIRIDMHGLVASLSKVSELRLVDATLNFDLFFAGLSHATHLSVLELSQCNLGDHEMVILAGALSVNRSITTLNLGCNLISDAGIASLVENWNEASPLKNINLCENRDIGRHGVQLLLLAVAGHDKKTLDSLKISCLFGGFGYDGLQTLAQEALPRARVRNLDLYGSSRGRVYSFEEPSSPAVVVARKNASEAVLQAVQRNTYLHQVTFAGKELTPDVDKAMNFVLAANRHGRHLLTEDHGLGEAIWCPVLAKCHNDVNLIYFFLREHPALVRMSSSHTASVNDDNRGIHKKRLATTLEERAAKRN